MKLTKDTELVIEALFSSEESKDMKVRLIEQLNDDSSLRIYDTPESRERIWLAIIKQCKETLNPWGTWFDLAKTDWRDLLMAADFGHDTTAHLNWKRKMLSSR